MYSFEKIETPTPEDALLKVWLKSSSQSTVRRRGFWLSSLWRDLHDDESSDFLHYVLTFFIVTWLTWWRGFRLCSFWLDLHDDESSDFLYCDDYSIFMMTWVLIFFVVTLLTWWRGFWLSSLWRYLYDDDVYDVLHTVWCLFTWWRGLHQWWRSLWLICNDLLLSLLNT